MKKYDIERMNKVRDFYSKNGIMPTYLQLESLLDRTRNAVFKFVVKMIKNGRIKKIGSRIAPGDFFLLD